MIYAVILIILGVLALLLNVSSSRKRILAIQASISPLFIIWGTVGIVILSTIRYGVIDENMIYWFMLILGSAVQIIIGLYFIYRYFSAKKNPEPNNKLVLAQNILAIIALVVGLATIITI